MVSAKITVYGRVQGVGYRYFTWRRAEALSLTGYVRNLPDGKTVEVVAEGEREKLDELIRQLEAGPRLARVERVETAWSEYSGNYPGFTGRL